MSPHDARHLLYRAALLVSLAGPAMAVQERDPDSWTWRVAPYLWTAGVDGTLVTGTSEVDLELDFSDIWDNLESGGLLLVEASRGRFSILGDVVYLGLEMDGEAPSGADVDVDTDTTILDLAGLYRVSPTWPCEVGVGLRYARMETELDVGGMRADGDEHSLDGLAVGRAHWPLGRRWSVSVYGDVGAGDADLTWQASALLGLDFEGWGVGFGYRVLDYDFEEGTNELDLTFEGLVFGAELRF